MRKILIIVVLTVHIVSLQAQSIRDEIRRNIRCSAGNFMAYPGPVTHQQTLAPQGKRPFYISHYGSNGSSYHEVPATYELPYLIMQMADSLGKLTPLGRDVMQRLDLVRKDAYGRYGELTELGAMQHRDIVRRMVEHFPDVFEGLTAVDARCTEVPSCLLSMENAMVQLSLMRPELKLHHNSTKRDYWYLDQQDSKLSAMRMDSLAKVRYDAFAHSHEICERLMLSLFNDTAYVHHEVDATLLTDCIFRVAGNIQNTEMRRQLTLYDLFTDDEVYSNWKRENAARYITAGASPLSGSVQPYSQRNLLRKLIVDADSCLQQQRASIQLRYGQQTVMSLACLLNLNGFGLVTDDLESLDRRGWADYRISPMASNIQFIFYRSSQHDPDIVFKVLLNENEATLPFKSDIAPYYHWNDFRRYFLQKLNTYEKKKH